MLALGACGNMAWPGGGSNGGGGNGGGAIGGSGGGASGGSGGGGSGGTPDYVSGTRIKARVQSTADRAKPSAGFYDSMLATPCSFGHAADDTVRCLPTTYAYIASYFAGAGCTTPLAYSSFGCAPAYANQTEAVSSCVDIGVHHDHAEPRAHLLSCWKRSAGVDLRRRFRRQRAVKALPSSAWPCSATTTPSTFAKASRSCAATSTSPW